MAEQKKIDISKIKKSPKKKGKGVNGNLTQAGIPFKDKKKASEAGKKSKPFSKYKYSIIKHLGLGSRKDEDELKTMMSLPKSEFDELVRLLLLLDYDEIEKLSKKTKKVPVLLRLYARGLVKDVSRGETKNVKEIADRVFGKPAQEVNATVRSNNVNYDIPAGMTIQEAQRVYLDAIKDEDKEDDE